MVKNQCYTEKNYVTEQTLTAARSPLGPLKLSTQPCQQTHITASSEANVSLQLLSKQMKLCSNNNYEQVQEQCQALYSQS